MDISLVTQALLTVHSASSAPENRAEAQATLDHIKESADAAMVGWTLADPGRDAPVRHFGLSLLQHVVVYRFSSLVQQERLTLRQWVVNLAFSLDDSAPHYIREKISYLWVTIAKRVWGSNLTSSASLDSKHDETEAWVDMDPQLLELWNSSLAGRLLSLSVYRNLFEDLYLLDDPVAARRSKELGSLCIETVVAAQDVAAFYDARHPLLAHFKASNEGWFQRWAECAEKSADQEKLLTQDLETLKACLSWVLPAAITQSAILPTMLNLIKHKATPVRILATDCLHILFTRTYARVEDFDAVIGRIQHRDGIQWLADAYHSVNIDPANIDSSEYVYLKKLIEMIVGIGEYLESPRVNLENSDIHGYLALLLEIAAHPSLLASGLCLQFWCSLLRLENSPVIKVLEQVIPDLLKLAVERSISYDKLPSTHDARRFMAFDFDSSPDSSQFMGNYRKYMEDVVRLIVCRMPLPSLNWLHESMTEFFQTNEGWQAMNGDMIDESSPAFLLCTKYFSLVETALRGVLRWQIWAEPQVVESQHEQILAFVGAWCKQMLALQVKDAIIHKKLVECLVQFASVLKEQNEILFQILERVLTACTTPYPEVMDEAHEKERERIRNLRSSCGTELNRLGYIIPSALAQIYDDLERVIGNLLTNPTIREYESVSLKSFLLIVSQRSTYKNKAEKFSAIVDPVLASWSEESTVRGLADLEWFMERVGIVSIAEYFRSRNITADTNLLETPLDEKGWALKLELKQKWQAIFPIRPTRIFIQYTIEKLEHSSPDFQHLLSEWKPRIQPIVPHILQLIRQIAAYHNPKNWTTLPHEVQTFVKISCTERFWQAGISTQTKDEFDNQNSEASKTLRDFADSVGHIIRYTREYAYLTLGSISHLNDTLYGLDNVGDLLFQCLVGENAQGITTHCWRHMIALVIRNLVRNCPERCLPKFIPEFFPQLLTVLAQVFIERWAVVSEAGLQLMEDEQLDTSSDLSEEMMDEYLLRQLTAIVVRMIMDLIRVESSERQGIIRKICLQQGSVAIPLLRLCRIIMVLKDSKCSFNICVVLSSLLVAERHILNNDEIAQFFCSEIMPAAFFVLGDTFFQECHHDANDILTSIHCAMTSRCNNISLLQLQNLLPYASSEAFEQFQEAFVNAQSVKQTRGVMLDFLTQNRATQNDDETRQRTKNKTEKRLSKRYNQDSMYDADAVLNLFGDK